MDPNTLMLAKNLAEHFCTTRFTIGLKHKIRYPTFPLLKKQEQQVLIETFAAILTVSQDLQLNENLQKRTPSV